MYSCQYACAAFCQEKKLALAWQRSTALSSALNCFIFYAGDVTISAGPSVSNLVVDAKGKVNSILPELRTGVVYDVSELWGISFTYMHAFGSSPSGSSTTVHTASGTNGRVSFNSRGPTMNSALIGVQYRFVD